MTDGVFAGVRVVELAQYVFVPGATVMMADQGAEVIKIEPPITGDPYRTLKIGDGREVGNVNLAMEQNNRGKKSLTLDLKSEEGREALLKLIETADVFVTSLRPKAIRGLKLTPEDLFARNPRLIYARGNGLGFKGEEADKAGFDSSAYWARGGACYAFTRPGAQPTSPRPSFGDHQGSVALGYAIAGGLYQREKTGRGMVVESSLLATAAWSLSGDLTYSQKPGYQVHGTQSHKAPLKYGYITKDQRNIQIMLLDPRPHWPTLCKMLDLEALIDDPRFHDNDARMANADALIDILQGKIGSQDWAYWKPIFFQWDAPWELIKSIDEVLEDPQIHANDIVYRMDVDGNDIHVVSGPATFDGQAAALTRIPSPALGADTDRLLGELGYSADAIRDLRAREIA